MQRIRDWMAANRDEAPKIRASNRSFIFFRITGLSNDGEPVGGQGVPLAPGRSIAVDKLHVYGTPFFIDASLPIESAKPVTPHAIFRNRGLCAKRLAAIRAREYRTRAERLPTMKTAPPAPEHQAGTSQ